MKSNTEDLREAAEAVGGTEEPGETKAAAR